MKITPKYLTYANKETQEVFKYTIDDYGDSYFEEIDIPTLEGIFENIEIKDVDKEYNSAIKDLMKEYKNNALLNEIVNRMKKKTILLDSGRILKIYEKGTYNHENVQNTK